MKIFSIFKRMTSSQLLALGFALLILLGTGLLSLPISSSSHTATSFITALFTSTSATCVTGLTLVDTYPYWSFFGRCVIIVLIQIGGLGFITLGCAVMMLIRRKVGIRQRGFVRESLSALDNEKVFHLLKMVIAGTAIFEGAGAIILTIRFIPMMGFKSALYFGIFHSISAFCNAGFDLMGKYGLSSFEGYQSDPVVVITICLLILIGGLGFIVWQDIYEKKLNFRKYMLQTKIVLSVTLVLVIGGAVLFYFIECSHSFEGESLGTKILNSLFCAVTPRTAGFNTIDYSQMSDGGKFLTTLLMFVGGGSGSTAGGVKMGTVFVILLHLRSTLTRSSNMNCFKRRIDVSTLNKATALASTYIGLIMTCTLVISVIDNVSITDTLFEVVSAVCTVGITAGLTRNLCLISHLILIALMYIGRLGSLTFALSFTDQKRTSPIKQPIEDISIG